MSSQASVGVTAGAIARELETWPRRQVKLAELQALLVAAEPALEHAPERRERLADVLGDLVAANLVQLPSSRSFDRSAKPALPRFVRLDRERHRPRRRSGADVPWRPELAWASERFLDEQTLADLRAVNGFLRDGGVGRMVVPLRERSLQLFGDEKRLEALMAGQLFAPGRLTLEQLRCEAAHPPFVYERVGTGDVALVVENHHTFVSLVRVLPADGSVGTVIYGAGAHFKASVTYVADLRPRPARILYFGDLDSAGLGIPVHANAVAVDAGLPPVGPAVELYRLLLSAGTPAPASGPSSLSRARSLTRWLGEELQGDVERLLLKRNRLAQEWVGTELLASRPALLAGLGRAP
jgi:hypothetical protein